MSDPTPNREEEPKLEPGQAADGRGLDVHAQEAAEFLGAAPMTPGQAQIDWKSLALETGNKLAWAVSRIKAPGLVYNLEDGEAKRWEDDVIETLQKFPGAKIDREGIMAKYLSPKERAKFIKNRKVHNTGEKP
jgi:hypothetical protein